MDSYEEGALDSKDNDLVFWADRIARKVIDQRKKDRHVAASGITPSGTVHIGNLREEMTAAIVARAMKDAGADVRYYHSWDDFDRFRKIPGNLPDDVKEKLKEFIGKPVCFVPDPFGCHESYALHFEKEFEEAVIELGIRPEYIYQHKNYLACKYAEGIRTALQKRKQIEEILSKFKTAKKEDLTEKEYWPCEIYCEKCWKDLTSITAYDGEYAISYRCNECGNESCFDFRKVGNIKLKWRIDWPMRWSVEGVDFEPGGKEHSTPGGSRTTAVIIAKEIYNYEAPIYQMYDFILGTGGKGKMSGSKGNVISPAEMMNVYIPQVFRYLYVSQRPVKEFIIPFDIGVNKIYEDFYKCERIYFGTEAGDEKWKRIYELSSVNGVPKKQPVQIAFSQMAYLSQFFDFETVISKLTELGQIGQLSDEDRSRLNELYNTSKHWIENYVPEEKITVGASKTESLTKDHIDALKRLAEKLDKKYTQDELQETLFELAKSTVGPKEFFRASYLVLIGKEKGPRLAELIKIIGEKETKRIIESV